MYVKALDAKIYYKQIQKSFVIEHVRSQRDKRSEYGQF